MGIFLESGGIMNEGLPNSREDRIALLLEDMSWHFSFFGPAWEAYCNGEEAELKEIVLRYKEVTGGS